MQKVIGLITCNYSAKATSPLTEYRPISSLPFLGRYRLVAFALSNLVNAGIRTVGMVMPYNYRSIIDHVESGKDWDLDRKNGGLFVLPGSAFGTSRTGARFLLRDLVHNKVFFTRSTSDYVIFSSANFVFNMDFNELYRAHVDGPRHRGAHEAVPRGRVVFPDRRPLQRQARARPGKDGLAHADPARRSASGARPVCQQRLRRAAEGPVYCRALVGLEILHPAVLFGAGPRPLPAGLRLGRGLAL